MTQARTLSSLVGSMARQGVDKPNVHPIVINGDLMVNNHRVVNNTLTGLGDGDEGYIIHVGFLLENNYILHSHGKVRIDRIDQTAIYNLETKIHSHKLRIIKKIF